jgi:tetratricopeptide (TPR) repeat protein
LEPIVMADPLNPIAGRRVAFCGKLGGMTLREAHALVRRLAGTPVKRDDPQLDLLIVGADEPSEEGVDGAGGRVERLCETELWRRLGLIDDATGVSHLYTPATLARLVEMPVAQIRRWHRRGLLRPTQTVHRLPYFDFAEIAVARQLQELSRRGVATSAMLAMVEQVRQRWPESEYSLAELPLVVEGQSLLIRSEGELREPGGQRRFDWSQAQETSEESPSTIELRAATSPSPTVEQLVAAAEELEEDDLAAAADMYRAALAAGGPDAQICFQLAECLYRLGDLTAARERYSMAVEIDDAFLEARANLGCVLADLGQLELAIAALEGALSLFPDFADAHYHLAQWHDACGRTAQSEEHRRRYEQLAPQSPWASQAPSSVAPPGIPC